MIHIELKNGKYYVDGKLIIDELQIPIRKREVLKNFKNAIESGLKIKSTTYEFDEEGSNNG